MIKNPSFRLFSVLAASIMVGEILIMLLLHYLPPLHEDVETIVDAVLLLIFVSPFLYFFVVRPIDKYVKELQLARNQLKVTSIAFDTNQAILITDQSRNILRANKAFEETSGFSESDVIGQSIDMFFAIPENKDIQEGIWQDLKQNGMWRGEIYAHRKDGEIYPQLANITRVGQQTSSEDMQYVVASTDITLQKQTEQRIYWLSSYNELTGLPNRKELIEKVVYAVARSAQHDLWGSLILLDLDNFKLTNDSLGHEFGDELLGQVSKRLTALTGPGIDLFHLDGDSFVFLLNEVHIDAERTHLIISDFCETVRVKISEIYLINQIEHYISCSIGACLFRHAQPAAEILIRSSEISMYHAKKLGRNRVQFFDDSMETDLRNRAESQSALHSAIINQELELFYQIQVDGDQKPVSAEALIRWNHPTKGLLSPGAFIPIAEESSLIQSIDQWTLRAACKQLGEWRTNPLTSKLVLGVNISARQFKDAACLPLIKELIIEFAFNPNQLMIEVTESLALDNLDFAIARMHKLKNELSVQLSLDDFGTGYSSLSYLKRMPFDQIKIDQSFIKELATNSNDATLVKIMIEMSRQLGFEVIAEGVETAEQFAILKNFGCDLYQGYLFSRPIPANALMQKLQTF